MTKHLKTITIISVGIIVLLVLFSNTNLSAQNVAVTDDETYTADSTAMLDVKSESKGLLIPRLTTIQRNGISNPAHGLLVYDSDEKVFYYYEGSSWVNLSIGQAWEINSDYVYLSSDNGRVGIGSSTPNSKLEVKADNTFTENDTLFAVKDQNGNIVFAVFPDGAKVYVNSGTKGKVGGFAVSGRTASKATETEYLRVTPDSTRIYINEPLIKGSVGGFAVSGRTATKGLVNDYLYVTGDSTRIYVNDTSETKGKVGGFAVSGRSSTKGSTQPMFFTTVDSTRIFTKDANKGFGVSDNSTGSSLSYLNLSPQNYFIGHRSGDNNSGGSYNLFLGYESGRWNNSGASNVFIGPNAGHQNSTGFGNIFIGNRAGYSNANIDSSDMIGTEGSYNVYIGYNSAEDVTRGRYNTYIGYATCASGITGEFNTYIGNQAGNQSKGNNNVFLGVKAGELAREGNDNVFLGNYAGHRCYNGSGNVFVGYYAGYGADVDNTLIIGNNSASKLITGDFTDNQVGINGDPSATAGNILRVNSGTTNGYYSSSGWTHSSDRRLKTNIETVEGALDKVLKMNGVYFNWIANTDKRQVGFIAQDMQNVLPEVVYKGEEDYLTITYDNVVPVLVNAIKEQQDLIKDMQLENEELKQKLNEIIKLLKK